MTPEQIQAITPPEWDSLLRKVYRKISSDPRCAGILKDVGQARLQFVLTDRPDLSFWEEYSGDEVVHHLGVADAPSVEARTTSRVLIGTLLQQISIMEAAADEAYEMRGDTETLMRCANLLPYVMAAFSEAVKEEMVAA
jgi:hypothetical protein